MTKRPDSKATFERKARLQDVGNRFAGILNPHQLELYRELVSVGEGTVALETLVDNLEVLNVELDAELLDALTTLAQTLKLTGPRMQWLKHQAID